MNKWAYLGKSVFVLLKFETNKYYIFNHTELQKS